MMLNNRTYIDKIQLWRIERPISVKQKQDAGMTTAHFKHNELKCR